MFNTNRNPKQVKATKATKIQTLPMLSLDRIAECPCFDRILQNALWVYFNEWQSGWHFKCLSANRCLFHHFLFENCVVVQQKDSRENGQNICTPT